MFRSIAIAIIGCVVTPSVLFAEDQLAANTTRNPLSTVSAASVEPLSAEEAPAGGETKVVRPERPWPLPALYGSSAFLQGFDAYLTVSALKRGAKEVNPILRPVSDHPVALIAVKAGLTAASFVGAERLWKENHRASAVALMVVSNAMMVVVAAHNNAVLQRIK